MATKIILDDFYNIDGNNETQVRMFQNFANSKGEKLKVDGKYGRKTKKAYQKYGVEFETQMGNIGGTIAKAGVGTPSIANTATSNSKSNKIGDKIGSAYDKANESGVIDSLLDVFGLKPATPESNFTPITDQQKAGMSTGAKIGIAVGVIAVIAVIVIAVKSSNKPA